MIRRRVRIATAVAACVAMGLPSTAWGAESYRLVVTTQNPQVRYFEDFTYDKVVVTGPSAAMARTLTKKVRAFTMPIVDAHRDPNAKMLKYLKKARPASLLVEATPTPSCHKNYVCLSQLGVFSTPILAGSLTSIEARAWSATSGKAARLRDFVPPDRLKAFTARVKQAIRQDDCYYGFDIDLPASYDSFPNWVPLKRGIAVWFPEYQFGCQIMSLRISWG